MKKILLASISIFGVGTIIGRRIYRHFVQVIQTMIPNPPTMEQILGLHQFKSTTFILFSFLFGLLAWLTFLVLILLWNMDVTKKDK